MQIPQSLSQFTNENVLIIVAGARAAKLYLARDGLLEEVHAFDEPTPRFSDTEGYFARSGHGQFYGSGSPDEIDPTEQENALIADVTAAIDRIAEEIDLAGYYLTAPEHTLPRLRAALPESVEGRARGEHAGNYLKEHPLAVLERVLES